MLRLRPPLGVVLNTALRSALTGLFEAAMLIQFDSQFGRPLGRSHSCDDEWLGLIHVSLAEGLGRVRSVTYSEYM